MNPRENVLIIGGHDVEVPPGLHLTNYRAKTVQEFAGRSRKGSPVNELVVHESVTTSVETTVKVLQRRGFGVHLMVAPDGHVTQHADLADTRLAHAGGHNGPSVAIEVVNPYEPKHLPAGGPWRRTLAAPWAHGDTYVLPTFEQAEAVAQLIDLLTKTAVEKLCIPKLWAGLQRDTLAMGPVDGGAQRAPGIYAHHYFAHADGAWPVLYAWLRLEARLQPQDAYVTAASLAAGARRQVNLSKIERPCPWCGRFNPPSCEGADQCSPAGE